MQYCYVGVYESYSSKITFRSWRVIVLASVKTFIITHLISGLILGEAGYQPVKSFEVISFSFLDLTSILVIMTIAMLTFRWHRALREG